MPFLRDVLGVKLEVVPRQLGHSTPMLTLQTYGMFIPTGEAFT